MNNEQLIIAKLLIVLFMQINKYIIEYSQLLNLNSLSSIKGSTPCMSLQNT